jgi:tetratricopeptide (TPR) repeat protein
VSRYSRQDVLRILHLHHHQLAAWERAGLVLPTETYSFAQLRTLRDLRATRLPSRTIRASVTAMQRMSGVLDPLLESSVVRHGSRVSFRYAGALLDPVSNQLSFDFEQGSTEVLQVANGSVITRPQRAMEVQEIFLRAVHFEEDPSTLDAAALLYNEILQMNPGHAPASINLGTIHYNRRDFARAEELYRNATAADPDYALAFFDLGNVLDETLQLDEAIAAYQRAIALVPHYADAHYNLALAYERQGEKRRALRHWLMYTRLDPVGPWASHAKIQARKILSSERLSIVSRRGQRVPIAG